MLYKYTCPQIFVFCILYIMISYSVEGDITQTFTIEMNFLWDQRLIIIVTIVSPKASHQLSALL